MSLARDSLNAPVERMSAPGEMYGSTCVSVVCVWSQDLQIVCASVNRGRGVVCVESVHLLCQPTFHDSARLRCNSHFINLSQIKEYFDSTC